MAPRDPRPLGPSTPGPSAPATATAAATAGTTALACCATMASLRVLAFDHEGRPVQFDTWLDDWQLYLLSDSKDSISLFDLASCAAPAPPATADSATRSQWLTRNAAARLAIRNHLPLAECAHFRQHRHSFATVEDLVSHLRTSDARYRATVPAGFLDRNQAPMFITLYFIVTRLPDSLHSVRDHLLSFDPTSLTVDLLEQHLLAAETSAVAVGAARGTPRPPFFEGCSPSPLAPSYASVAIADVPGAEDVGAASASAKRRSGKGKGGRGGGGGSGSGGGGSCGGSKGSGGGGSGGSGGRSGGVGGGGGGSGGSGGTGGSGTGGSRTGARRGGSGGGQRQQQQQRRSETQSPQQLREWLFQRGTSGGSDSCPYVICTGDRTGQTCGRLHTQHHCFSRLDDAWRAEFGDDVGRPQWADLLRYGVAILSAMYALIVSAEGDCYRCVPLDPGIAAAALSASESVLPGTLPNEALHTFTLDSEPPQVASSAQVSASGQIPPPCSCRLLSHQTLLWHHRLCHPSLPRHRSMHSCLLVSDLPRSPPPLPPSPALPCLPCVEGRQRAAPHSSFPPMTTTLQTLHMDVWGPARVSGHGRERYFLLVVDDYTRYTTFFFLRSKGQVVNVLIPWICAVHLQLGERFRMDLPVLHLHSDTGGEFSSNRLRDFCRGEGILQSFTLPDSPKQNGIAECRIGLVMEVARTTMIHVAAPHFLWPFAVQYAAHQHNLWPRVSLPETSPTLRWTRKVGDALVFRVCGSRAFVRDTSVDRLYARAIPSVFLGFVLDAPDWQFYHPTSRRVLPSQDVTFDESVPFYRLFPYHSAPLPPPPLLLAPGPPLVEPLPPQGPAPSGVSQVDPPPGAVPSEVAVDSGAARGNASWGAEPGGAELGGAEPQGTASSGGSAGASPRLSPQQLREWLVRSARPRSRASTAGAGGAGVPAGAGITGGVAATSLGGARTQGTGAARTCGVGGAGAGDPTESRAAGARGSGTGGAGAGGAGVGSTEVGGARAGGAGDVYRGGTVRPRPYFPASPLCAPSRYTEQSGGLTGRREPVSRPVSHVRTARRVPCLRPPPVRYGTLTFLYSTAPTVSRLLATVVTNPSFESTSAPALVAELVDFSAACCLDYATPLVAESESASPPSVGGRPGCTRHPDPALLRRRDYGPYSSQWQAAMDAEMASWKSIGTYVDEVSPRGANIVNAMWIFRLKRPPGSPPSFKRDYELHSLDFSTAFLQGSLHEEIWLRHPPGFTGSFLAGTQWSLRRPVYGLRQAPREWHDTLRTTLSTLGFAPSTADPSLFLRTDTSLPPFYVLVYVDYLVFATADTEALTLVKSELQKRHTCSDLGELRSNLGVQITRDRARHTIALTQSHMVHQVLQRFGFQFSSPQPTPLSTSHSLSAPPSDKSVEPSGP
ncbi:unnamed protein product [Closterium sp. NIES-54]